MPAHCATCDHPDRAAIDQAIALGSSTMRSLATKYGMHRTSLARHAQNHLSPALVRAAAERETAGPRSVLDRLEQLESEVQAILAAAREGGKVNVSLAAVRELRSLLETIGRITGELRDAPQVAVVLHQTDEWQEFRDRLLAVLADYPEAEQRVLAALPGGDAA